MELIAKKKFPIIPVIVAGIAGIVIAVVLIRIVAGADTGNITKKLQLAAKYYDEMNYEEAVAIYEKILQIDPKNEEAYDMIIASYACMGDIESALKYSKQAYAETGIEKYKGSVEVYSSLLDGTYDEKYGNGSKEEETVPEENRDMEPEPEQVPTEEEDIEPLAAVETVINEASFPNEVFRNYVRTNLDVTRDGVLSVAEIEAVRSLYIDGLGANDLTGIGTFVKLEELTCGGNELTRLDVSRNRLLTKLACDYNSLTELDISKNRELVEVYCCVNQLTTLDTSRNSHLSMLICYQNPFGSLSFEYNSELTRLSCYSCELTSLDVSGCTNLTNLYCWDNKISNLDLSNNKKIKTLSADPSTSVKR